MKREMKKIERKKIRKEFRGGRGMEEGGRDLRDDKYIKST